MNTVHCIVCTLTAVTLIAAACAGDEPKPATAEVPVAITVGVGSARAVPSKDGSSRTGGGNIAISQPAPDALWATMTGAVAAKAHPCKQSSATLSFDLCQEFEVVAANPKTKKVKLAMWGRAVGMLRCPGDCVPKGGSAEILTPGRAAVKCGDVELISSALPSHTVGAGQSLSVYDRAGPAWVVVSPGKYSLHQSFGLAASCGKGIVSGRPISAEFAPGETLLSDWLGKREPFHGANKDDFGFQIVIKVIAADNE